MDRINNNSASVIDLSESIEKCKELTMQLLVIRKKVQAHIKKSDWIYDWGQNIIRDIEDSPQYQAAMAMQAGGDSSGVMDMKAFGVNESDFEDLHLAREGDSVETILTLKKDNCPTDFLDAQTTDKSSDASDDLEDHESVETMSLDMLSESNDGDEAEMLNKQSSKQNKPTDSSLKLVAIIEENMGKWWTLEQGEMVYDNAGQNYNNQANFINETAAEMRGPAYEVRVISIKDISFEEQHPEMSKAGRTNSENFESEHLEKMFTPSNDGEQKNCVAKSDANDKVPQPGYESNDETDLANFVIEPIQESPAQSDEDNRHDDLVTD